MALDKQSVWRIGIAVGSYLVGLVLVSLGSADRNPMLLALAGAALIAAAFVANRAVRRIRVDGQLKQPTRLLVPAVLTAIAIAGVVILFNEGTNGLAVSLLVGGLITFGHFLSELRWWWGEHGLSIWWALVPLVILGVVFGTALLAAEDKPRPLLFAAIALAVSPLFVMLASETLIRGPLDGTSPKVRVAISGAGLVVAIVGCVLLGGTRMSSFYVVVFAVVMGLLVLTIASNTQADILLVAIVGVLFFTGLPKDAPADSHVIAAADAQQGDRVIVSLGDSYMSGEGAEKFYPNTNKQSQNECRRAPTAYAVRLLDDPASEPFGDDLVFLACSAATGDNVVAEVVDDPESPDGPQFPDEPPGGPPQTQLTQVRAMLERGVDVSLVIVSIGGNDAGFGEIARSCLAPRSCVVRGQQWLDRLSRAETEIGAAYDSIQEVVGDEVPVLVVPYPQPINAVKKNCGYSLLEPKEHQFLNGFVVELDKVVKKEAVGHGFSYLAEMEGAFEARQMRICDPESDGSELGVNFIALDAVDGLAEEVVNPTSWVHGSLHPNEDGHERMSEVVAQWMLDNPSPDARSKPSSKPDYPVRSLQEIMGDSFSDDYCGKEGSTLDRCSLPANQWTVTELARFLAEIALPALVFLLGAWILWLPLLRWTRDLTD